MKKIKIYTKVISLLIVLTFILTGNVYPLEYRGALRVPLRGAAIVSEQLKTITDKTPDSISAPLLTQEEITVLERPVKWIMAQLKVEPEEYDEIRNKVLDILSPAYKDRENTEKQQEATEQLAILWGFNLESKLRRAEKELAELLESNLTKNKKRESELEKSILDYKAAERLKLRDITFLLVKMIPADLESSKGEAFITLSRLPKLTWSNLKLDKPIDLQENGFIMLRVARAILIGSNQYPDADIKDLMKTLRYILNKGEIEALNLLAGEDMQGIRITKTEGRNTAISFYVLPGCLFTEREIIVKEDGVDSPRDLDLSHTITSGIQGELSVRMSSSSPTLKEIVETLLYVSVDDVYNLIRQNDGLSHLNEKNTKINYDQVFLLNADRRSIVYFELIRIGPLPAESYRIEVEKTGDNKVLVRKQMDRANPGLLIPLDFAKKVTVGVDNVTLASGQTVSEVIQDTARNYGFLSCPKEIDYNGKGLLLSGIVKKESENDRYLLYYVYKSLKGKGKNPEVYFALVDKDMNIVYFDNGAPEHNNEWKVPLMPGWQRGFTNEISDRNIPISDIEDAELSKQVIGFFIERNLTGPEITSKQSNVEPGLFLPVLRSLYNSYAETKVIVRLYEDREGFLSPREDMGYKNKRNEFNRLSTELLRLAQRWYLTKARIKKGQSTAWALEEFIDEQAIKKVVGGYDSSGEKVLGTNQDRLRENL